MKNEFKSGYTYTTKDGRRMLCLSILDTMILMQSEDGITLEYHLDGTAMAVSGVDGKHSEHLDLVPGLFTKQDALKEMKLGNKVQHIDWLNDDNGLGKYWYYKINNKGKIVDQDGDVIDDWEEYADGPCWWQICPDFDYEAHENLIYENKSMAEFLESLGYSQEQISHIANGGCPKSEIELLREEVTEMGKQPMTNASAIERFKRKIESLENASISKEFMKEIDDVAKKDALEDVYSDIPCEISNNDLWDTIMSEDVLEIEGLVISEEYECCHNDIIRKELQALCDGYKSRALEVAKTLIKHSIKPTRNNINTLLFYKVSAKDLSEDTIAMLDGHADYVWTGLGKGSMFFELNTLREILDTYEEDTGDNDEDAGSDSSYKEFSLLVKLVVLNGCKGLFLANGESHE